jgi:hypothetical protein
VFSLLRGIALFGVLILVTYFGATVPLGERTFFGHVRAIWAAKETRELVDGVKQESGPLLDKVKRGVKTGVDAARGGRDAGPDDARDAGVRDAAPVGPDAQPPIPKRRRPRRPVTRP